MASHRPSFLLIVPARPARGASYFILVVRKKAKYYSFVFDIETLVTGAGYIGLFAIVFIESGVFFGFFLPGDSLIFTAGFLASQGFFDVILLWVLLLVAAIGGDSVGYSFGKHVGPKLFTKPKSIFFSPKHVERAEKFFEKYGKMSIFLARFVPAVRTFVPIVAGVGKMKYEVFIKYNVVGGFIWVTSMLFLGYFLGKVVPNATEYLHIIIIVIIIVSFLPIVIEYLRKKKKTSV